MGAKRARARIAWAVGIGAVLSAYGLAACAGDDTNPPRANSSSGSSGGTDATTTEGGDQDTGTVDPQVCARYGGYTGVTTIADDILTAVKADCRIGANITALPNAGAHLRQCFEKQLGTLFGCPGVVYDQATDGKPCRSMADAHKDLNLRLADFNAFISDTNAVLKTHNLSDSDRQAIVAAMNGTQTAIVPQNRGLGDVNCTCPNMEFDGGYCGIPDAGLDGGKDGATDAPPDTGGITDAADEG
jgi:hypothetical protein